MPTRCGLQILYSPTDMDLNFDDFIITKGDFEFFQGLSKEEKLFFLHDLLCEQAYGVGSEDSDTEITEIVLEDGDLATIDPAQQDANGYLTNFEDIAVQYEKFARKMQATVDETLDINILVLNNYLVFNSISLGLIASEIRTMFEDGYIMKKYTTSVKTQRIFQHQKFCMVYEIMGKILPQCKN